MRSGTLSRKVSLRTATTTRNDYGEEIMTYNEMKEVWAEVKPISGREYYQAGQLQNAVDTKVTMRYSTGVNERTIVRHNDIDYNVVSVIDTGDEQRELVLMCNRVTT